jgi:hypothetical protein
MKKLNKITEETRSIAHRLDRAWVGFLLGAVFVSAAAVAAMRARAALVSRALGAQDQPEDPSEG